VGLLNPRGPLLRGMASLPLPGLETTHESSLLSSVPRL
jgi:hypothetical protein